MFMRWSLPLIATLNLTTRPHEGAEGVPDLPLLCKVAAWFRHIASPTNDNGRVEVHDPLISW